MRFETNVADRKLLARKLAEFTGERIHYLGPPSFAYSVGGYLIARDGAVSTESEEGSEALRVFLEENNLLKPEVTELVIRLPLLDMDADALKRLVYMVRSKQYLLNKAVGADSFAVSEELVTELETTAILDRTAFLDVLSRHDCRGLAFDMEYVSMTFHASRLPEKNEAFAYLAAVMVRKAGEAKRISSKPQEPDNEKYYFRIWLVQLGMDGADFRQLSTIPSAARRGLYLVQTPDGVFFYCHFSERRWNGWHSEVANPSPQHLSCWKAIPVVDR